MSQSLDYSLDTYEDRLALVNDILQTTPQEQLTTNYIGIMTDYLLFVADKNQTKKERKTEKSIITKNREITVQKRQISYEGLSENLETGEEGLYNMIRNDKNMILDPKDRISRKDIAEIPGLQENLDIISRLAAQLEDCAVPANKYSLKQQIISKYQEQYIIRSSYRPAVARGRACNHIKNIAHMPIPENVSVREDGTVYSDALVNLYNPQHISFLLCNYPQLKQESWDDLHSDMRFLLIDLENLAEKVLLENHTMLYSLLIYKIDGRTNAEIASLLEAQYGVRHTEQYFSALWRKKIPKLLAEQAQKDWLIWYFSNIEYGEWKKCGRCGEYKLAHPMFYSKNSTSKDGYYSICKQCRNS